MSTTSALISSKAKQLMNPSVEAPPEAAPPLTSRQQKTVTKELLFRLSDKNGKIVWHARVAPEDGPPYSRWFKEQPHIQAAVAKARHLQLFQGGAMSIEMELREEILTKLATPAKGS